MAKLKVTVLYDLWEEEPAEVQEEVPPPRKRKGQKKRTKKPVKHDREEIFEALEKLGHEPSYYVLDGRLQSLVGLAKCGADLIFNLTESYAGDDTKEMQVTAFLDLLDPEDATTTPKSLDTFALEAPAAWAPRVANLLLDLCADLCAA